MLRFGLVLALGIAVTISSLTFAAAQATGPAAVEIAAAQKDLGARLRLEPASLVVERVETRQWPDTSLDCPQPGMTYAKIITPGYYILLRNGGDIYEYHADRLGRALYCSRNILSPHEAAPVAETARWALAQRVGSAPVSVESVEEHSIDWAPDPLEPHWSQTMQIARMAPVQRPMVQCPTGGEFAFNPRLECNVSLVSEVGPNWVESFRMAYLVPAQAQDGFNLWDLALEDPATDETRVLIANVSDFCVAPSTGRVVCLRRLPGGMDLIGLGQGEVPLLYGRDFRALSWDGTGTRYTVWTRESERGQWRLVLGAVPNAAQALALPDTMQAPGLPQAPFWQGDLLAFTFEGGKTPRSFMYNVATREARPLPEGRFAGWLDVPGEYLRIASNQLLHDSLANDYRFTVVARIPGLTWARPLPGCSDYVAVSQEGALLRVWTAPLKGQRSPRLVSEFKGEFVRGQVSERGNIILVQNIAEAAPNRQECRVTLVSMVDGTQEPLTGLCPRAQLLPSASVPVPVNIIVK